MVDVLFEAKSLTLTVGQKKLIQEANFCFFETGLVSVEGENGAGKSSFLKEIYFNARNSKQWEWRTGKKTISYLGHELGLYTSLSLEENLNYFLGENSLRSEQTRLLLQKFKLQKRIWDPVSTFSRGMKQKSALLRILLGDAPILLLDEPFTGLDLASSKILIEELNILSKSKLIILVLHGQREGLNISDTILLGEKNGPL